jgi:hypothetical protein
MPGDRDPKTRKQRDYRKQARIASGESRHSERRNRPERRARTHRSLRKRVRQILSSHDGLADPSEDDRLQDDVATVRLPWFVIWRTISLGEHVKDRKRYRAAEAGRVFFREPYDSQRHMEAFARFLESVVRGGVAPSSELAERFNELLDPGRANRSSEFLEAFFVDEPKWRQRLQSWINRMLQSR